MIYTIADMNIGFFILYISPRYNMRQVARLRCLAARGLTD